MGNKALSNSLIHRDNGTLTPYGEKNKFLASQRSIIKAALPFGSKSTADKYIYDILTLVNNNKSFEKCTPQAIFNACMTAVELDLPVSAGLGYVALIPRGDTCQLQLMYRGLAELVMRSDKVVGLYPEIIYENDESKITLGSDTSEVIHSPKMSGNRGAITWAYVKVTFKDGRKETYTLDKVGIDRHREAALTKNVWNKHEAEQSKKSVLHMACKTLPLSTIDRRHIALDHTVMSQENPVDDEGKVDSEKLGKQEFDDNDKSSIAESMKANAEDGEIVNEETGEVMEPKFKYYDKNDIEVPAGATDIVRKEPIK